MIVQILFPAASPWEWTHIWTCCHNSVLPTTNTHTLESDFSGLFWLCEKKHAKGLQTHLFAISSIPACTGAWRGPECRNNWAKCGENEQDECIGAKGGGLSLGSDAASKSKLKKKQYFTSLSQMETGFIFYVIACEYEPIAERERPKNTHFWICCRLNNHHEW